MSKTYGHRKPVRRHHAAYKYLLGLMVAVVVFLSLAAGWYFYDKYTDSRQKKPVSQVETRSVSGDGQTFRNAYFQFRDNAKWVLGTKESNENKYIYHKHRGLSVEHQLIVYVNQVPIPLYLAVARTLPVRIVNGDSFDITNVSDHCVKTYTPAEPHRVKEVSINGAVMLCDPDTPQYSVVLSEIGGDYRLNLKRLDGSAAQFVITYRSLTLEPDSQTIKNIMSSFQAL